MSTHDTTIQGGRYIVGGQLVNAKGEAIEDAPKLEAPPTDPLAAFPMLAGYTVDTARAATDEELMKVEGVNKTTLAQIRKALA